MKSKLGTNTKKELSEEEKIEIFESFYGCWSNSKYSSDEIIKIIDSINEDNDEDLFELYKTK